MSMTVSLLRVSQMELEEYKKNSIRLEDLFFSDDIYQMPNFLDLNKAWDGILFLLSEQKQIITSIDLTFLIFSGNFVDENQDLGFGPAHYLNQESVRYLNSKISELGYDELKQKFAPDKMNKQDIYPSIWNEGESAFEYLIHFFNELKQFYQKASQNNEVIISILS